MLVVMSSVSGLLLLRTPGAPVVLLSCAVLYNAEGGPAIFYRFRGPFLSGSATIVAFLQDALKNYLKN